MSTATPRSESIVDRHAAIVLSPEEAEELYRFTRYEYLSPQTYPALQRLVGRLTTRYAPRA